MKKRIYILLGAVLLLAVLIVCLITNIGKQVSYHTYVYEPEQSDEKTTLLDHCKLLAIGNNYIDLQKEDGSVFRYQKAEDMKIYTDASESEECDLSALHIGLVTADYLMNSQKLITKAYCVETKAQEKIRVLIDASNYDGRYHDEIILTPSSDMTIISGRKRTICAAGHTIRITPNSSYFLTDHIVLEPKDTTQTTSFQSIERAIGTAHYKGNFEIMKTDDGLVLINELSLEDYLYRVVPSEMPASSPVEALKAQAICARTYAYMHIEASSLRSLGAHLDDSTSFQVYGNIETAAASNLAVDATKNQMLYANGELCETYFYSTSCGYSSGIAVWHVENPEKYTYLGPCSISRTVLASADALADESIFREYLSTPHSQDYECEDPFYRWSYTTALDRMILLTKVNKRKEAANDMIHIVMSNGKEREQISRDEAGLLEKITVTKRLPGGAMDEIVISFENVEITVIGERNIREILVGSDPDIRLNHDLKSSVSSLLPSAFAYIDMIYRDDEVSGYRVIGGGYGHGIGMSQNAARHMAEEGMNCNDILQVFYEGEIKEKENE